MIRNQQQQQQTLLNKQSVNNNRGYRFGVRDSNPPKCSSLYKPSDKNPDNDDPSMTGSSHGNNAHEEENQKPSSPTNELQKKLRDRRQVQMYAAAGFRIKNCGSKPTIANPYAAVTLMTINTTQPNNTTTRPTSSKTTQSSTIQTYKTTTTPTARTSTTTTTTTYSSVVNNSVHAMPLPSRMSVILNSTQTIWPPATPLQISTFFKRTGLLANSGTVVVGSVPPQPLRQHQPMNNIRSPKQNANQHNLPMSSLQSIRQYGGILPNTQQ